MHADLLNNKLAHHIWETKYRFKNGEYGFEQTIYDTWQRVARALASTEAADQQRWEQQFLDAMDEFKFIPGGRILAGAGTDLKVTLFNCFVMGTIEDSIPSIFEGLREGAETMQQGGGVGYDFSTLRPNGWVAKSSNNISSGPVSFMKIWDAMCNTMMSTGARRGAMMATLRCDHPDITEFIEAKQTPGSLSNFNLSVLVTDRFMEAVENNEDWPLVFPWHKSNCTTIKRRWSGVAIPVPCRLDHVVSARKLWDSIMRATYDHAEPGVLFIDRINRENNLNYNEQISSTNPCGEVPLPPYGACDLGSINLTQFVQFPFTPEAHIDLDSIASIVPTAVRMLDNVISLSRFPIEKQRQQVRKSRRIGLGITGLADALIMLGKNYGSKEARKTAGEIMECIRDNAYRASVELAGIKGTFSLFDNEAYINQPFIQQLPTDIRRDIEIQGIHNSHLLSIAPTGSISLLAGNLSGGMEPVFDFNYSRKVLNADGSSTRFEVTDYAYRLWRNLHPHSELPELPDHFIRAEELSPDAHLKMQAVLQNYVDQSISKTINIPWNYSFENFKTIYSKAYELGLKGCTTFRPNQVTGSLLKHTDGEAHVHCCTIEREAD